MGQPRIRLILRQGFLFSAQNLIITLTRFNYYINATYLFPHSLVTFVVANQGVVL